MTDTIYLVWHKNPDTDSILSTIVYKYLMTQLGHKTEAIKIGPINNETKFILENVDMSRPRRVDTLPTGSKVFLLDHNAKKQAIDNIDELEIVGLIDHHNFGGFSTNKPIYARLETVGCTNTILYKLFKEHGILPSPEIAKLMISAIVSDTLLFRSPTTTEEDKAIVAELNKIAKIEDIEQRGLDMFNAKSDLWDISAIEIVKKDFKNFDVNGTRLAIWVMETTNPGYALNRKSEILEAMAHIKKEDELDFILFSIVDILNEVNTAFVLDVAAEKIISDVFGAETNEHLADLWNRISRKKQIVPNLTKYFNNK